MALLRDGLTHDSCGLQTNGEFWENSLDVGLPTSGIRALPYDDPDIKTHAEEIKIETTTDETENNG